MSRGLSAFMATGIVRLELGKRGPRPPIFRRGKGGDASSNPLGNGGFAGGTCEKSAWDTLAKPWIDRYFEHHWPAA